jgi:uncharacterized membrane protein
MEPAINVAVFVLLFAGTHVGLATRRVRGFLVSRLGPMGFSFLFSAIAATTFALFMNYYASVHFDGVAGLDLGRFAVFRYAAIGAIVSGIVLLTASLWRFPASTMALVDPRPLVPRGMERITRHPFFVGVAMLAVAHILLATRLVGCVAFAGLALLTIAGAMHQDAKLRAELGAPYAEYLSRTSLAPFVAIAQGRQHLAWRELPWMGMAVGVAIAFSLRSVHASIVGHGGAWVIGVVLGGAAIAIVQTLWHRRRSSTAMAGVAGPAPR